MTLSTPKPDPTRSASTCWELESELLATLIRRAQSGSTEAFADLYSRTARWLLSHVRRVVDDGQAEDVLAEAYIGIWRNLASYDEERAPPAVWMVMIARSRALDHLRREKRNAHDDPLDESAPAATGEGGEGPDQLLSRLEERRMVQLSLEVLNEKERLVVGLAYFRENTHMEIAAALGLPLSTVKSMMSRAQAKMRGHMTTPRGEQGLPQAKLTAAS